MGPPVYDLTSLLSTIASCSGTFIAIVGGFIARKLISISQERHSLEAKRSEVEEEVRNKTAQMTALTIKYRLDDAVDTPGEASFLTTENDFNRERQEKFGERDEWIVSIEKLCFQKEQLDQRLENLKNPRGMKKSLLVFAVFSIFGVLLPMTLMPFRTESFRLFAVTKTMVILLFAGCLAYAYRYFLYLLRWKNKEVIERWREYVHGPPSNEKE